ncbi:sulfatase-like hydrolase/transferase [Pontiellaceae bacterium B12227]|nr:sulfatase-like hydrolase/transferase [Pontiellaceae bacterium B12227]
MRVIRKKVKGVARGALSGFVISLLVHAAAMVLAAMAVAAEKPNVVMIFIDDMGYGDVGAFGNTAVPTPNMDRLAKEGMKFTNFYVNSPICSASRVALTTGLYPQRERIHSYFHSRKSNRNRKMPDWLPSERFTYAKLLKQNGYATAHFGKWHMGGGRDVGDAPLPQAYGYDEALVSFEGLGERIIWNNDHLRSQSRKLGRGKIHDLPKHKTTETYVDRAIDFMKRNKDKPFLVNVFPNDVHDPHQPSSEQLAKWKNDSRNRFDEQFFAVLDEMDRQIGRLLKAIDDQELTENTIVIFTSDNGPTDWRHYYDKNVEPPGFTGPLFGRKWSLYEGGIRMPFMIRWPGHVPAGKVDNTTVMAAMDLLPSIGTLTGSEIPVGTELDGTDISKALLGKSMERSSPLFWEYGVHGSIMPGKPEHVSPKLAVRDGDWKLLMNPNQSQVKLFNLKFDIGEKENLADVHPERTVAMKKELADWWQGMNACYEGY